MPARATSPLSMYGNPFPRSSSEFLRDLDLLTSPSAMSSPLCPLPQLTVSPSVDTVSEVIQSGNSGSYNSPCSLASCCTQRPSFIRSVSSHSLQNNELHGRFASNLNDLIDSDSGPVRRVFSTGDLHQQYSRRAESPLSNESHAIIEGMSRACRYSPEEKKERIQRYRTKRKHRNFNKKIKYACRKTLADSRPRIRGRFIRNTETETNPQVEWSHLDGEEEEEEMNWISFLNIHSHQLLANP